jgi:hypothetical protein
MKYLFVGGPLNSDSVDLDENIHKGRHIKFAHHDEDTGHQVHRYRVDHDGKNLWYDGPVPESELLVPPSRRAVAP